MFLTGGGSGFIGSRLANLLMSNGYEVKIVSRMPGLNRISWHDLEVKGVKDYAGQTIINMAGQNVLDPSRKYSKTLFYLNEIKWNFISRWTIGFRQNVYNSRINTTSLITKAIMNEQPHNRPELFLNISGVSGYKPDENKIYTEDDPSVNYDFMSELCVDW